MNSVLVVAGSSPVAPTTSSESSLCVLKFPQSAPLFENERDGTRLARTKRVEKTKDRAQVVEVPRLSRRCPSTLDAS